MGCGGLASTIEHNPDPSKTPDMLMPSLTSPRALLSVLLNKLRALSRR